MKYKDWLEEWLDYYIKPTAKERTYVRYREIAIQHLIPQIGEYELDNLTPMVLQKFITYLSQSGNLKTGGVLSPNSVNSIITVLQSSLKTANRVGASDSYVADKIRRPKIVEKQITCFSLSEQRRIEESVIKSKKTKMIGILLCLYTGLRVGEVLALEWVDIDFSRSELTINKNCHDGRDKNGKFARIVDSPKTIHSHRIIPIPRQLLPYLKEARKKSDSKYVVNNGEKSISVRSYQKTFSSLLKNLKIQHRGFHALRHTFATRALECGMDVRTLSEILGHKSPTITLNRYVHSLMDHKKEMMNKLGRFL